MNRPVEVVVFSDGRIDVPKASEYLGLSDKTLAMKRGAGDGLAYIKCGRIFYFNEDLDGWILREGKRFSTAKGV